MTRQSDLPKLRLLPYNEYAGVNRDDPLRFYFWPIIGRLYRRRVELCLAECAGGGVLKYRGKWVLDTNTLVFSCFCSRLSNVLKLWENCCN